MYVLKKPKFKIWLWSDGIINEDTQRIRTITWVITTYCNIQRKNKFARSKFQPRRKDNITEKTKDQLWNISVHALCSCLSFYLILGCSVNVCGFVLEQHDFSEISFSIFLWRPTTQINKRTFRMTMYKTSLKIPKGVIRIRISKRNRQHIGQKKKYKRTKSNLQNIQTKRSSNTNNTKNRW